MAPTPASIPPEMSLQLASIIFSSFSISSPSPQARASLTGVAISIGGNILISIALNVQKLSHMRLADQKNQATRIDSQGNHSNVQSASNGQLEGEVEEEDGDGDDDPDENESTPLTPSPSNKTYGGLNKSNSESRSSLPSLSKSNRRVNSNLTSNPTSEETDEDFDRSDGPGSGFLHSRLWWLGISLMALGEMGNFLSYGFAPASLVAPLGAVALLSNVLISPILLGPGEAFSKSDFGGMILATIGAVTVVFSSKESNARLGPGQLIHSIKRKEFLIYSIVTISCAIILMGLSRTRLAERFVLIDVGVCALFGGFTVLSTKGLSSLLSARNPLDMIKYPITYVLLAILIATAIAQITYLNRALYRFDSREVIPTQFVFFTISAIVGSAVLYRDFENVEPHRFINFIFGCLTTFGGVFILTRSRGDGDEIQEERYQEQDSTNPSPVSTPRKKRSKKNQTSSTSSNYLQVPGQEITSNLQELDLDLDRAVTVDILTPTTPSSEAEREDMISPLVSTSLRPSNQSKHPGITSSITTGSVPLSNPRRTVKVDPELSGSLPNSSHLSEGGQSFVRNHRLSFPGPRSSPRATPGLGFSAGHYLLLASSSSSNSQGLLVPTNGINTPVRPRNTDHVRTRSQSTPGNRRRNQEGGRREREESSEGNAVTSSNLNTQETDRTAEADEIGDLQMEFEEDEAPKRRSTIEN